MIKEAEAFAQRVVVYNAEEKVVAVINSSWGGDDKGALDWINLHNAKIKNNPH